MFWGLFSILGLAAWNEVTQPSSDGWDEIGTMLGYHVFYSIFYAFPLGSILSFVPGIRANAALVVTAIFMLFGSAMLISEGMDRGFRKTVEAGLATVGAFVGAIFVLSISQVARFIHY